MSKLGNWFFRLFKKPNIDVSEVKNAILGIASGDGASVNFYHSADYKFLKNQLEKAQQHVKSYPDDASFRVELKEIQEKLDDFKRDVLKLAEVFNKIPINTERLRLAKQHFEAGDYQAARAILDAETMSHDQDALLDKKQRLDTQQAEITKQLTDNATEFLLKARLTAIDYSLNDRIAQTSQFFEQALKSARTPDNIFAYAVFLQENNQFKDAECWYREALDSYRQLAKDNPALYLPDVAMTLNNLGILVKADTQRRAESENLFKEVLDSYRQLAKDNPAVYLPNVAITLNNLGNLVSADTQRRAEAENLYKEALDSYRQLAKDNPTVYLPYVAMTLNNLGALVSADTQRIGIYTTLYTRPKPINILPKLKKLF
jgi:tetratricopeptide (TPR) repeat protein